MDPVMVILWMGLLLFRGSHKSRSMGKGSELFAYEQERIDVSLAVPLSEQFEARSMGLVFDGQLHSCAVFNEQVCVILS